MEKNFNLYQHIIKMVEIQINENTPPVTKETYERLLTKGYDSEAAKEKIAVIIAEEMYEMMMSDEKKMNLESYSKKLALID